MFQSYPELQGQNLLKSYQKIVSGISYYRLLFLTNDKGIVEIQIILAPKITTDQIQFVDLS